MKHETFILALCCLVALCFTMAVIALFALLYAIIGNVWVALLATLLISAMATPKDICPVDEEPEHYISERIESLRELVEMYEGEIAAYCDIEDGWETKEED